MQYANARPSAYSLKQTLSDPASADKFDAADKETLQAKVDETIAFLDNGESADTPEIESYRKSLEECANPIMTVSEGTKAQVISTDVPQKFYSQGGAPASGMPGAGGDAPGGFPGAGGAAPGAGGDGDGPSVEEVD